MQFPIFELSPQDFERLCLDLLNAEGGNLILNSDEKQRWFDITGERLSTEGKAKRVAIEVKHRTTFHPEGLRLFVDRLSKSDSRFDEYVFMTSSPLTPANLQAIQTATVSSPSLNLVLLGQQEIFQLLEKHPKVAAKYFKEVAQKVRLRRLSAASSLIGIIVSALSFIFTVIPFSKDKEHDFFESQIQAVESNLSSLRALEHSLTALRKELENTSEESARIKREYEEALKLKAITSEQLEQIKKAVSAQSASDTFLNYFFGFLLGAAGSILATIITDRWKAKRALSGP
jgi:hypothetical protein